MFLLTLFILIYFSLFYFNAFQSKWVKIWWKICRDCSLEWIITLWKFIVSITQAIWNLKYLLYLGFINKILMISEWMLVLRQPRKLGCFHCYNHHHCLCAWLELAHTNICLGFRYVLIILIEIAHTQRAQLVNDIKIISIRINLEKRFHFPCGKKKQPMKKCSLSTSEKFLTAVENPKTKYQHILVLSCWNFYLLPFCNQHCFCLGIYVHFPHKIW